MAIWPRSRRDPRISDEVRFHRDCLIEQYIAAGVERQEAERRAFLEFGSASAIEEEVRDVRGRWLQDMGQDLRYTLRTLRRGPVFAVVVVLSLALGIGANSAIFSLVNAVMLQALPVHEPDRLVQLGRIRQNREGPAGRPAFVSYPIFERFRDNLKSVSALFAQATFGQPIAVDGEDDLVTVDAVSGSYFGVLGLAPIAGRFFGSADDVPSAANAPAVITDRYWQRRFGRRPDAIGTSIALRQRIFTIVGVTPPGYAGAQAGRATDLIVPLATMMTDQQRASIGSNNLAVLGRLRAGTTVNQANAEVEAVFGAFLQANASLAPPGQRTGLLRQRAGAFFAPDGFNPVRDTIAQPLLIVMGIVGLILLLACVNLSGLLLARAETRQREVSVRLAIGAGRWRLARQFLTESLVLAVVGGGVGLAMAVWFSGRLLNLFLSGGEVALSVTPDWRVLAFTAIVSVVTCIAAGLAPALRAVRVSVNPGLKEVRAHGHGRLGKTLVVAQLAISMVLVVGATLFLGTLVKLYAVDRGFESDEVLVINVRHSRPFPPDRAMAVQRDLLERLRTLPDVRSASAVQVLPVAGNLWDRGVQVEGYESRPNEPNVGFNVIAPGYFATLGTPVLSGREFTDRDGDTAPKVAIVNDSFARHYFGERSPLGRRVTSVGVTYEIVGVVRNSKYQDLREATLKTMYIPWAQHEGDQPSTYAYLVRGRRGRPAAPVPDLDRLVRAADAGLRVRTAMPYQTVIDRSISNERVMATLGGLFGSLGLLIAGIGMFGVLAFQVAQRTNELGVRMVLGAQRWSVMRLVLRDVVTMLVPGIAIGVVASLMLTGLARGLLFDLAPDDLGAFAVAASVLTCAALLAGWLPARRASHVDPMVALRHE
jgi:putative ABC transport system permease protein